MAMQTQRAQYAYEETQFEGIFYYEDSKTHRTPGILVIHGGAGLDDHAKGRARRFAESGYIAFACDMYGAGVAGNRERVMDQIMGLRNHRAKLCGRARAAIAVLNSHHLSDGRSAVVGYCFGGMAALELGRSGEDIAGIVSVHGSLQTSEPAPCGSIKAKILVCHGALDPHVPQSHVTAFMEEMNGAAADWQLNVYGGAMHGFTHEGTSNTEGVAYNAHADARSSIAIRNCFAELFGERQA